MICLKHKNPDTPSIGAGAAAHKNMERQALWPRPTPRCGCRRDLRGPNWRRRFPDERCPAPDLWQKTRDRRVGRLRPQVVSRHPSTLDYASLIQPTQAGALDFRTSGTRYQGYGRKSGITACRITKHPGPPAPLTTPIWNALQHPPKQTSTSIEAPPLRLPSKLEFIHRP